MFSALSSADCPPGRLFVEWWRSLARFVRSILGMNPRCFKCGTRKTVVAATLWNGYEEPHFRCVKCGLIIVE